MDDLNIALWQTPHPASIDDALHGLDEACAQARAQHAHLLVTPEMALTGYAIGAERLAASAEAADGALALAVAQLARRHGLTIVYGYPERNVHGKPYNAAQAIAPDGTRLMNHRKTHLYGDLDRAQFSAGDVVAHAFEWRGWRLGLLICYEVEFPETVRLLALQGVDAVLVPTANMEPFDEVQRVLLPARALENRMFIAYANACGAEAGLVYNGLSLVCAPDGRPLWQADRRATLHVSTLGRQALGVARTTSPLPDRRPALYDRLSAL